MIRKSSQTSNRRSFKNKLPTERGGCAARGGVWAKHKCFCTYATVVCVCLLICVQSNIDGLGDSYVLPLKTNTLLKTLFLMGIYVGMFQKQARRTTASTTEDAPCYDSTPAWCWRWDCRLSKLESHLDQVCVSLSAPGGLRKGQSIAQSSILVFSSA